MERCSVEAGGERFEALACGPTDGPLALHLHGFPDVPATWAPVMKRVAAAGYRCVAPYMRGYGGSTREGPFHVDRLGEDALALADALSPERQAVLLGHDWGAVATYAALARAPSRFAAAVTVAVPHPGQILPSLLRHPGAAGALWYMAFFQLPRWPERALTEGRLLEWLWRTWSPGFEPPEGHLEQVRAALREGELTALEYYRALPRSVLRRVPDWEPIGVPTLHLHGRRDGCIAGGLCDWQHRHVHAPQRLEWVDAGHFAPLEVPARVAELALEWLARHAPADRVYRASSGG